MEGFSWLPKFLLELSVKLLNRKNDVETKQRLADLLEKQSECIDAIAIAIQTRVHPAQRCVELATYLRGIQPILARAVDEKFSRELTFWLEHVAEAPGIGKINLENELTREAKPRWSEADRFQQVAELKNVASMIRATANLLRV